jgi:hypothetical protein
MSWGELLGLGGLTGFGVIRYSFRVGSEEREIPSPCGSGQALRSG